MSNNYQKLWEKYYTPAKTAADEKYPLIKNQEEAVAYSLKVKKALEEIAAEQKTDIKVIFNRFAEAARVFHPAVYKVDKIQWIFAYINQAAINASSQTIAIQESDIAYADIKITKHNLFFNFQNIDDLFLFEENDINSVFSNE